MVGVSVPLNTEDRRGATRFTVGLAAGSAVTTLLLGVALAVVTTLVATVPPAVRFGTGVVVLVGLGALDLADRTPQLERQVPQRFARVLDPGLRGLLWGADLATLVSTRKATSLLWAVLLVVPLLGHPGAAVAAVAAANAAFVLGVTVQTKVDRSSLLDGRWGAINISREVRQIRRGTGSLVLVCAALLAARWLA